MKAYGADLHVHTCLSPCAEPEMTPRRLVAAAAARGIQCLAVTDHNSCENVAAVMAAAPSGIMIVPGVEVQTREDVHLVCLFPELAAALAWQEVIYAHLPSERNRPDFFGPQVLMDAQDRVIGENPRLLLAATTLGVDEVLQEVGRRGGLVIAAHVDRPSFSLLRSLGFLPQGLPLAAVELSPRQAGVPTWTFPGAQSLEGYPTLIASDAHRLEELQPYATLVLADLCWEELRMALAGEAGRKVLPGVR